MEIFQVDQKIEHSWPIQIVDKKGNKEEIFLQKGEMLYLDHSVVTTSRPQLQGEYCDVFAIQFNLRDIPQSFADLDYDKEYMKLANAGSKTEL